MPLFSHSSNLKKQVKLDHKNRRFKRSWKKKFHNYRGEEKNGFQIVFLLQGAITHNFLPLEQVI